MGIDTDTLPRRCDDRFNEIDLCGIGNGKANRIDPIRDVMAKVPWTVLNWVTPCRQWVSCGV